MQCCSGSLYVPCGAPPVFWNVFSLNRGLEEIKNVLQVRFLSEWVGWWGVTGVQVYAYILNKYFFLRFVAGRWVFHWARCLFWIFVHKDTIFVCETLFLNMALNLRWRISWYIFRLPDYKTGSPLFNNTWPVSSVPVDHTVCSKMACLFHRIWILHHR